MKSSRFFKFAPMLIIGVLFAISALVSCTPAQTAVDDGRTVEFRSDKLGFRVSYPAAWQALEDPRDLIGDNPTMLHAVAFVPNSDSKSLILTYVQTLTNTPTLDEYVSQQMADLQANEVNARFSDPTSIKVGDVEARATAATVTVDNQVRLQRVVMLIRNQRAYGLTYTGPTAGPYVDAFEAMLKTFAFLP